MPPPPNRSSKTSDFDAGDLLAKNQQHDESIGDLTARLAAIEAKLATPQSLAAYFKSSTEDSRTLDGVFADMFCRFLKEHAGVKECMTEKIAESDRNYFQKSLNRFGKVIYAVLLIVIGASAKECSSKIMSFIPGNNPAQTQQSTPSASKNPHPP
ncbi:MAG TPA: hypothetical protein VF258_02990, partial [Luteolibacter sp.]